MNIIGNYTNTNFLQRSISHQIKEIRETSERISSGKRVNRASDDVASIGTISRLNAELGSISQALLNGGQAKVLTQTAESGLSSINNLLSRVRELAVEGTGSTLTDADRTTLQVEVDAYLAEIDAITSATKFNDIKLLDGSTSKVIFNIGIEKNTTLDIGLTDVDSIALSLSATSGVNEFTSGRVSSFNYSSNLVANDILINGENALAATLTSNLTSGNNTATALATAINANTSSHGAVATAFNKLTSSAVATLSMSNTFTINSDIISTQTSMTNLVTEINQAASGVTATLNSDAKTITLSNTTGNDIVIAGNAPGDAGFTSGTYLGYLKLVNNNDTFVKIEANTKANGYSSNQGNIDDLQRFGFNEIDSSTQISSDLVSTNALTASHDIKINDVAVGTSTSSSAAAKAVAINAISSSTNVTASGSNLVTLTVNVGEASSASSNISINGNAINFSSVTNAATTIAAINNASIGDIVASVNTDADVQLTSASGADIIITHAGTAGVFFDAHTDATGATISVAGGGSSVTFKGLIELTHASTDTIKISGDDVAEIGMKDQASTSSPSAGSTISVSSTTNATSALTSIDTAIDTIANARGKFGSAENRIDHRINNLIDVQITSTSRLSKIEDADFALETSRLAKAQIISKAASSMLAQANASGDILLRLVT
jgi:flagellin